MVKLDAMYPTSEQDHRQSGDAAHGSAAAYVDPRTQLHTGLGRFMAGVYGWMSAGLLVTAVAAYVVSTSPAVMGMLYNSAYLWTEQGMVRSFSGFSVLGWVVLLSPLAMAFFVTPRMGNMSRTGAVATFMVFSALLGASMGHLPFLHSLGSIGGAFLITAGMFASLSFIGFVTKRDLSAVGRFGYMAVIGLILATAVSWFVPGISLGISALVVLVFAGLTAYNTQQIKQVYLVHGDRDNVAIMGALSLYLDFINMFQAILHLLGGSRD
ncbi:MAG: Bax inhibitor-1/YccA family protein [Myxococcales bacterium FL481]|nr:MAG: Bax inhibitor-1/YccA family protein [Myxococcales bacterium FL481]